MSLEGFVAELLVENARLRWIIKTKACKEFLENEDMFNRVALFKRVHELSRENEKLREQLRSLNVRLQELERENEKYRRELEDLRTTIEKLSRLMCIDRLKCYELAIMLIQNNMLVNVQRYLETGVVSHHIIEKLHGDDIYYEIENCKEILLSIKPQKNTWII